jgi:hypothetical protein
LASATGLADIIDVCHLPCIGPVERAFSGSGRIRVTVAARKAIVVNLTSVRAVDKNLAFADGKQTISAPDGKVVLVAHLASLLRRDGDGWRFVDGRPYVDAAKRQSSDNGSRSMAMVLRPLPAALG